MRRTTWVYTKTFQIFEIWSSQGSWKKWTFLPRDSPFSKVQIWHLEIFSFEKTKWSHMPHFLWQSQMINDALRHFHSSQNEWIWMKIWLNFYAFKGAITLFWVDAFLSNSFCYRTENNFESRRSHGDRPHFFVSLEVAEISRFPKLSIYSKIVLPKNLSRTLWIIMLPLQIFKKLWSFII